MAKAEHDAQLGTPTCEIDFTNVTHLRRFMHSETSHHAFYGYFFGDDFWVGPGGGGGAVAESLNS